MSAMPEQCLSLDDYYLLEESNEEKHEYFRGEAYAMTGASARHNLIVANLIGSLHAQLRGKRCTVYPSDLRLKVELTLLYTYPDAMVICGNLQFADKRQDTVTNPSLIIEVLSSSTENYDRGKKFEHYRSIGILNEYLLISQDHMHVEQYIRQEAGRWLLVEYAIEQSRIPLASIGCELLLDDIYEKVNFAE